MDKAYHTNKFFFTGVFLTVFILNSNCQNSSKAARMEENPSSTSATSADYEEDQTDKGSIGLTLLEKDLSGTTAVSADYNGKNTYKSTSDFTQFKKELTEKGYNDSFIAFCMSLSQAVYDIAIEYEKSFMELLSSQLKDKLKTSPKSFPTIDKSSDPQGCKMFHELSNKADKKLTKEMDRIRKELLKKGNLISLHALLRLM